MKFLAASLGGGAPRNANVRALPMVLLAIMVAGCLCPSKPARGNDSSPATSTGETANGKQHSPRKSSPYRAVSGSNGARLYYLSIWGIDNLLVRQTASGSLIRFSYRVVDPARAKLLSDKRSTPYMFGLRSHALLHVPVLEQVGPLRQSVAPKAGKEYWMVFSNKGNFVRAGDRVDVVIGAVRVNGLRVE